MSCIALLDRVVSALAAVDLLTPATKRNLYLLSLALRGVARRSKADEKSGEEWFLGPLDEAVLQSADNLVPYIASMCGVR